jgi:hypothetical protein
VNYRPLLLPLPRGVRRESGVLRASGFPGRRLVCRSGCAPADSEGFFLPEKLAAEKDLSPGGSALAIRPGVAAFPKVKPFRHGDVSLDRAGCPCIKIVNMSLNGDAFSDPTSVGARATSAKTELSVSSADNTNL